MLTSSCYQFDSLEMCLNFKYLIGAIQWLPDQKNIAAQWPGGLVWNDNKT